MRLMLLVLRFVALVAMCVWLGGFMFYGGAVVPIMDEALGRFEAGMITRVVTNRLNLVGGFTVAIWLLLITVEWLDSPRSPRLGRSAAFLVSASLLVALIVLHGTMDRHLDTIGTYNFKPLHRMYLMISTVQWLMNLAILGLTIIQWTAAPKALSDASIGP